MTRQEYMEKLRDIEIGETALLFFPGEDKFVYFDFTGGEQLLAEDYDEGFDCYIDITSWDYDLKEINESDGGIHMIKSKEIPEDCLNLKSLMYEAIVSEMFGECPDFMVLK